jgi:hypothetical protein
MAKDHCVERGEDVEACDPALKVFDSAEDCQNIRDAPNTNLPVSPPAA